MACPVCGDASSLRALCKVDRFDILACDTCGAEHAAPTPTQSELKAYYDRPEWFEGGERGGYKNYDDQTGWSMGYVAGILDQFKDRTGLSVLDVGCGYGTHLALAAERGWKCFGVEVSDHARKMAQERLGGAAYVVENVSDLIPHEFDLVLILDTLEHLPSPYTLLYSLFSIGAITPKTRVVISTPNAGSEDAVRDPANWAYRHPPSHLVFYTERSISYLLKRLHFTIIEVRGLAPISEAEKPDDLAKHAGLLAIAEGSNFTEFMRERYVPGTWSKIAEYEHVPRYAMAKDLASGKAILDFGCGTGYGSAMLARTAKSVTGLDIDEAAIAWASETHRGSGLQYIRKDDLGASLPERSFDMITCFEMIEHVDHATQKAVVASFARLLREDGVMLISTPNPETTKLYGENPYHIREMNEAQLRELLSPHFASIQIFRQYVRSGVMFDQAIENDTLKPLFSSDAASDVHDEPLAFIAICSKSTTLPSVPSQILFDRDVDYISDFMNRQGVLNKARLEAYLNSEVAYNYKNQAKAVSAERDEAFKARAAALQEREAALHEKNLALAETARAINEREVARHEKNIADAERDAARHEKNIADAERDAAKHAKNVAEAEREEVRLAYHYLSQRRDAELSSPRFLFQRLLSVTKGRVRGKLSRIKARLLQIPGRINARLAQPRLPIKVSQVIDTKAQDEETKAALTKLMAVPPVQAASQLPLLCTLVIPTKNGGDLFKRVAAGLQRQSIWARTEFIVVDSGSTDDTLATAAAAGAKCISIPPSEFNHGVTRDYAVGLATCDRVILSVQDAIPAHDLTLEKLVAILDDEAVAGGYARQIPQPDADHITKRNLNSWLTGRKEREVRGLNSNAQYDTFTPMEKYLFCNFDNVCSVIRKSVWLNERFGRVGFGEDIDWAERVLKNGHKIVYEPAAAVVHSHDRPLAYEYKRTYVCHRKLYAQFGLHAVPSLNVMFQAWMGMTLRDIGYVSKVREPFVPKLKLLLKIPALNALQVYGQYLGAKDEMSGQQITVKGV